MFYSWVEREVQLHQQYSTRYSTKLSWRRLLYKSDFSLPTTVMVSLARTHHHPFWVIFGLSQTDGNQHVIIMILVANTPGGKADGLILVPGFLWNECWQEWDLCAGVLVEMHLPSGRIDPFDFFHGRKIEQAGTKLHGQSISNATNWPEKQTSAVANSLFGSSLTVPPASSKKFEFYWLQTNETKCH